MMDSRLGPRHLGWIPAGAAVSFFVSWSLGDRSWLPVDAYYLVYIASVFGFFAVYARRTRLDLRGVATRRWKTGLIAGFVFGIVLMRNVLSQPAAGHLEGGALAWVLVWRGVLYGAADGLILLAFPWIVVWRAFGAEGAPLRARVTASGMAFAAILFVTVAYHWGYRDFRSGKLVQPMIGTGIAAWSTLLTANPAAAPLAHVFMHVGAVLRQPEGGLFLPPHRTHASRGQRQRELHLRSSAGVRNEPELAAVRLDDLAAHRKTEAQPGHGFPAPLAAVKRLED